MIKFLRNTFLMLLVAFFTLSVVDSEVFAKGGHYTGGVGGSRKGSHYVNSETGNKYTKKSSSVSGNSKSSSVKSSKTSYTTYKSKSYKKLSYRFNYDSTVQRDSHGRIKRSESAKADYLKAHGYNKVPNGYQVDHIKPLYAGGSDTPDNMQLLTIEQHHEKTKNDYKIYGR